MNFNVPSTRMVLASLVAGLVSLLAGVAACNAADQPGSNLFGVQVTGVGPAPILGLILDQDYKVVGLVPDGGAAKAGVQVGDTIKHVNGQEITGGNSSLQIFRRLDTSKNVMLGLVRGQKEIDVELTPLLPPVFPGGPTATPMPPELLYF